MNDDKFLNDDERLDTDINNLQNFDELVNEDIENENTTYTLKKDDIVASSQSISKDDDMASTVHLEQSEPIYTSGTFSTDSLVGSEKSILLEEKEESKEKGKNYIALSFALVGVVAVIIYALFFVTNRFIEDKGNVVIGSVTTEKTRATIKPSNKEDVTEVSLAEGNTVADIVDNVMPAIVSIACTVEQEYSFFGRSYSEDAEGSGSGIIIGQNDKQVLIATNNHVIDGANKVVICFNDGEEVEAEIKGTDSSNDLAVVAVDIADMKSSTKKAIKIASIGKSEGCKVGDVAIAIGNALGYGQSVTVGVISALNRAVATEDYNMELIQTDAAINPGNSGGALLNEKGEVIGINSVKYVSEDTEGMGYAIPITEAVEILNELMNYEEIPESERAYLGIVGYDIDEAFSVRSNVPVGIYIQEISKGSPAYKSGMQVGDIIVEFAGKKVSTMENIQNILKNKRSGEKAEIKVMQASNGTYKEKTYTVTFGARSKFLN